MPAELQWSDSAQRIIICTFTGEFGIENYGVMEGQLPMMVREVSGRVDVILHLSAGAKLPPWRGLLQEIGIITRVMPPNFGVFVGVGDGLLLRNPLSVAVGSLFVKRYYGNGKVKVAPSVERAIALIMDLRR